MLLGVCVFVRVCMWMHNIPDPSLVKVGLVTGTVSLQGTVIHVVLFIFHPKAANHVNQPVLLHKHRWPTSTQRTCEYTWKHRWLRLLLFFLFSPAIYYTSVTVSRYSQGNKNIRNALKGPSHIVLRQSKKRMATQETEHCGVCGKGKRWLLRCQRCLRVLLDRFAGEPEIKRGLAVLESSRPEPRQGGNTFKSKRYQ